MENHKANQVLALSLALSRAADLNKALAAYMTTLQAEAGEIGDSEINPADLRALQDLSRAAKAWRDQIAAIRLDVRNTMAGMLRPELGIAQPDQPDQPDQSATEDGQP